MIKIVHVETCLIWKYARLFAFVFSLIEYTHTHAHIDKQKKEQEREKKNNKTDEKIFEELV